jgi:hypothetical protein
VEFVLRLAIGSVREGGELMHRRNVFGLFVVIIVSWTGTVFGNPPQAVLNQPVDTRGEQPAMRVAEPLRLPPETVYQGEDQRNAFVRWWDDHFKPFMQSTHWGYPEYFEEAPFGSAVQAHKQVQISNGWAARAVLYHYDFYDGDTVLTPPGDRRLRELAAAFSYWGHYPLLIEATPERPALAIARRNYVVQLLHDNGIPARVDVGAPSGFMPSGEESLLMNRNLLRQVLSGGGATGMSGGTGTGVTGAGSTAPVNTGAQ